MDDQQTHDDDGWELFTARKARPPERQPLVTIQTRGNMSLNQAAFEELGKPEAVELMYHPGKRLIGVRPASDLTAPHVYFLRQSDHATTRLLSLIAFAQHYGIPINTTISRRYAAETQNGMLVIDLNQTPMELESPLYGHPSGRGKQKQTGQ